MPDRKEEIEQVVNKILSTKEAENKIERSASMLKSLAQKNGGKKRG